MKIVSWNIARRAEAWRELAAGDADMALLQEATAPPEDVQDKLKVDPAPWRTEGAGRQRPWRAAVVNLSGKVRTDWIESAPLAEALPHQLAVSRSGTLAAAKVTSDHLGENFTMVSMYALWEKANALTGSPWIYADASVHRLISDLSGLIGHSTEHKIIAAGDLNILFGYGEHGDDYWAARYATVFDRFAALGLRFVGPQSPRGRQSDPWPAELPPSSKNVPTFHTNRQSPATATRQLDFVFASASLADRITVTALNEVGRWGPSDHCRLEITVNSRSRPASS